MTNQEFPGFFRGVQKTSLLDFPGKVACVLFVGGCSFKCPYCYNCTLVREQSPEVPWDYVWSFLEKRRRVLEGVCISGGEPTMHPWLIDFLHGVKGLGLFTKLDTNGYHPEVLQQLLEQGLLDYVAMDIKNSPSRYSEACGVELIDLARIKRSIQIIKQSGVDYEFRTTLCAELTTVKDIADITDFAGSGKRYSLQPVKPDEETLSGRLFAPPDIDTMRAMAEILEQNFAEVRIRGI